MRKAYDWVREHVCELLATLGAILLGFLAWGAYERKVGSLKDAVKVEKARAKIAKLEGKVAVKEAEAHAFAERDAEVGRKIVEQKRKVVEAHDAVQEMSDDEVVDRFNQLYPAGR